MVAGLNAGPLQRTKIDCVTCHRAGGPGHNALHPPAIDRGAVQRIIDDWSGPAAAAEPVRRSMSRYAVSLGVQCSYCHVPGNWKADDTPAMKTARETEAMIHLPSRRGQDTVGHSAGRRVRQSVACSYA